MAQATKSLHARHHDLSDPKEQVKFLSNGLFGGGGMPTFANKLQAQQCWPLKPGKIEILQVNVGYMCNQTCKHCHVDAGPDRKEIMTWETMQQCLNALKASNIPTLDLTGGAPEMNPDFRWFVTEARKASVQEIIVRSNLTILTANKKYHDLPQFFKENGVRVVSSLPYFSAERTDRQRGDGVFDRSITALQRLNEVGYGMEGSGLILDLVYNPMGAFLPGSQSELEVEFKKKLSEKFGVVFNNLFAITNLPISRFLEFLTVSGNYESYMTRLVNAFNPAAVEGVMCRNTISVGHEGKLYDCDFNQMLELSTEKAAPQHIADFNRRALEKRSIVVSQHCFGCTAGAGSSCQGEVT